MAATATKIPYADASPAQIREAILPEEHDQFDASLRRALDAVAETLSLNPLEEFLAHWRRMAWCQTHDGHDTWRRVLARAQYTLATGGDRPSADASAEQIHELLRRREPAQ